MVFKLKLLIPILILTLLSSLACADIISINSGGDVNIVINPDKYIEGFFFPFANVTIADVGEIVIPPISGGPSKVGSSGPYELRVEAQEEKYEQESEVIADIIISNTGDFTDKAVVFTIYLLSPSQIIYDTSQENIAEVAPGETTFERTLKLPIDSELGEWRVYAVYGPEDSPTMTSFDSFEVVESLVKQKLLKVLLLISIIFGVLIIADKNRQKRNYYSTQGDEQDGWDDV